MAAPTEKTQEVAEWIYKPIMYAWIAFKDGNTRTFYSYELKGTLKQIKAGHVKEVVLDLEYGYQSLWKMIEEDFDGKYNKARIYGLVNNNDEEGKMLREYSKTGELVHVKDPDFRNEKWMKHKEKIKREITRNIRIHKTIAHVNRPKDIIK